MVASPLTRDEQQTDAGVDGDVAEAAEHAVAVVAREGQCVLVDDPYEARIPTLVGAVRRSGGIGGGEEEHVAILDEPGELRPERVPGNRRQPIGQAAGVEPILELPLTVVVLVGHRRNPRIAHQPRLKP